MSSTDVEFRILGPLELRVGDRVVGLGGTKQRLLLAALLTAPNEVVSADRLVDILWGPDADTSGAPLKQHVHRLRGVIGPSHSAASGEDVLCTRPSGYLLRVSPDHLDVDKFERLVALAQSRSADGEREAAVALVDDALALWRGRAWAEFADDDFARPEAVRLEGLREPRPKSEPSFGWQAARTRN